MKYQCVDTLTSLSRLRLSSLGVIDILTHESRPDIATLQHEDLVMFGKVVISLCSSNSGVSNNFPKAIDNLSRHYSQDLKNVTLFLISKPGPLKVSDVIRSNAKTIDQYSDHTTIIRHDRISHRDRVRGLGEVRS